KDKKISVDLFETSVSTDQPQLKNSKFVKSIDFISVDGKTVTLEINLKSKASFDVFYLENPGRLVIDIR
ncbi:MAG: AMIN domain-containing protein, partial [Bacteriovoracaceae bacterium]